MVDSATQERYLESEMYRAEVKITIKNEGGKLAYYVESRETPGHKRFVPLACYRDPSSAINNVEELLKGYDCENIQE